mgnify:CR=1 FL=1
MQASNQIHWNQQSPYLPEFGAPTTTSGKDEDSAATRKQQCDKDLVVYQAQCYCQRVKYQVRGNPTSSKLCHCRGCQVLHGAPFEWVSIFHKKDVKFDAASLPYLYFYSADQDVGWQSGDTDTTTSRPDLPLKVSCSHCRTPIADEGRHMWLAFTTLFGFTCDTGIPPAFQHSCHLFYGQRCINLDVDDGQDDDKPKWEGHKNQSALL